MGDGDGGNDGHLRSAPRSHRSFTYSLSSPVSILSPLCVLLIYRAAGKCLRHSPSIVQPISLLFFLLLHLRVSSRHFLFPSPVRFPLASAFAPFSAVPSPEDPSLPFFTVPNILTDSDHKESSRRQREGKKKGKEEAWNPSRTVICRCKKKKKTTSYIDRSEVRERTVPVNRSRFLLIAN